MNILSIDELSLEEKIPDYIKAPRKWKNGSYKIIDEKYVGISFTYISPHSNITNNVFWISTNENIVKINSMNVNFIYEKYNSGLYKLISKKEIEILSKKKCNDCFGTGIYIGLMVVEKCKKCYGVGYI